MTPGTRVRVAKDPWAVDFYQWLASCPFCGPLGPHYISLEGALWEAEQHAAEPCEGIRLARLVADLEKLRDRWADLADGLKACNFEALPIFRGANQGYISGIEAAADDLDRLIKETNR